MRAHLSECSQCVSGAVWYVWFSQKIVCVCVCLVSGGGAACSWLSPSFLAVFPLQAVEVSAIMEPPLLALPRGSEQWTLSISLSVCVCVFLQSVCVFLVSNSAFKSGTVHWNTLSFMSKIIYKCLCVIRKKYLCLCFVLPYSFQDMVSYFGLKPKPGEKEVVPNYVFMLWYEFCNDFKNAWIRQSKNISKERWARCISLVKPCSNPIVWVVSN